MLDSNSLSLSTRVLIEALLAKLYQKNLLSHADGLDIFRQALHSLSQLEQKYGPEEEAFENALATLQEMKEISVSPAPNDRL